MLNNVFLIGRIARDLKLLSKDNTKYCRLTLAVSREYKNVDGLYESDFVDCILWNNIAINTCEYCKKGDLIGIKGRIMTSRYEKDEEIKYSTEVIADKVTFLSNKKKEEGE